ncbi:hypothetical protein SAMN05216198_1422 [Halopseudomonas litoralis]|uniref:Uncharacterized protein n=1 Tax=Halopseudomonas litoralis TaxID=797277 RepID=A0A1H1QAB6_9GAMM|nr:hypothetical protein [Halopseudomonas litoralis]SDS20227.1 hypothetical protein SAMN05216198_1422 [Halopseudomonas litoralis]
MNTTTIRKPAVALTVTLDTNTLEVLSRYRHARSACHLVGSGTDVWEELYAVFESAGAELASKIDALVAGKL